MRLPLLAHLCGLKPWEVDRLTLVEFGTFDNWIDANQAQRQQLTEEVR